MKKNNNNIFDLPLFLLTPEDSTEKYPDAVFKMNDNDSLHRHRYYHVIKTIFWVGMSALVSIMISQLR